MRASSDATSFTVPMKPVSICVMPQSQPPWHCTVRTRLILRTVAFAML